MTALKYGKILEVIGQRSRSLADCLAQTHNHHYLWTASTQSCHVDFFLLIRLCTMKMSFDIALCNQWFCTYMCTTNHKCDSKYIHTSKNSPSAFKVMVQIVLLHIYLSQKNFDFGFQGQGHIDNNSIETSVHGSGKTTISNVSKFHILSLKCVLMRRWEYWVHPIRGQGHSCL